MTLPLRSGRRYGYLKDKADHRDYGFPRTLAATLGVGQLPPSGSNLSLMGPVLDQGDEGSCTAHSAAGDREFLHWKTVVERGQTFAPAAEGMYSPSFIYYLERQEDGSLDQGDCGSYGRTSCLVLRKYGCALRSAMPYVAGDFATAPTPEQLQAALTYATGGYHRLATVSDMKSVIASGYNFRIGFSVYQSFESIGADGLWNPNKSEQVVGGHEVLAIGYDDTVNGGAFLVRNSWGASWGQNGNFWMRYSDAADSDILMDAWIQHLGVWR